ncbi:hypothetical protein AOLI_G00228190 [Acnodon oligacanthus]
MSSSGAVQRAFPHIERTFRAPGDRRAAERLPSAWSSSGHHGVQPAALRFSSAQNTRWPRSPPSASVPSTP